MRWWRAISVFVALAIFATACSTDNTAQPLIEPEGTLVSDVEDLGAVHQGEASVFPNLNVEPVDSPIVIPAGVISVGPGLRITENTPVSDFVEIRLSLPDEPSEEAIPGALRVLDDGSTQFVPGLWDPNTNEIIVVADSFSDWFGGWWNPLNWVEEAVDFAVDYVTGRTDPPDCQNNGPFWSVPQPVEISQVHVCHQTNLSENGEERAEVFLRSNRRTAQLIRVPDDPAYRWNGDRPDVVQRFLVEHIANEDPASVVWLSGAAEMSLGFERPEETADLELSSSMNAQVVFTNILMALLGISESDTVGVALAVVDCVDGLSSAIDLELSLPSAEQLKDVGLEVLECAVSIVQSSEFVQDQILEMFNGSGIPTSQLAPLIDQASETFKRLAPIAKKISGAITAIELLVLAGDLIFDSGATSRLDWRLRGVVPSNVERPTFVGQVEVTDIGPVHLLMDTSGSMADRDSGGIVKIQSAQAAVAEFIQSLDADRPIGLRTYPNGTGNDCGTGALRIAVENNDRTGVTAEVFGLRARGGTPTAEALRAAALDVANFSSATIVLVSDGESTCEPPCEVAEQLIAQGIDVTVLTAGIAIGAAGREELTCVANVTGGFYTDVETVEDLNAFFEDVSTVALSVELDFDDVVVAESAGDGRGATEVQARITNVGEEALAENVVVRFGFDELGPAVVSPVRSVGNLAPLDEVELDWSFRAGRDLIDQSVGFTVFAGADNSDVEFVSTGEISIEGVTSREDAGQLLRDRPNIAILGDSYSAGEGAHVYFSNTDDADGNQCHQSPETYLYEAFSLPRENLLACSGAVFQDFMTPNSKNGVESQHDQLVQLQEAGPVDAVVLSIGGNDVEFALLVKQCIYLWRDCDSEISGGQGAEESQTIDQFIETQFEEQNFVGTMRAAYSVVNRALNDADAVSARGEVAPIIVLGYPRIVPFTSQGCIRSFPDLIERSLFTFDELVAVNSFISRLNGDIEAAVNTANSDGIPVYFVPPIETSFNPDHTICNEVPFANSFETFPEQFAERFDEERLTFGAFLLGEFGRGRAAWWAGKRSIVELFHPNEEGYQAVTEAILRWSNSDDARQAVAQLEEMSQEELPDALERRDIGESSQVLEPDTSTNVALNDPILVSGAGFDPFGTITAGVASTYQVLGTQIADVDGSIEIEVVLPDDLDPGIHTVSLEGFGADGEWKVVRFPIEVPEESRVVGYGLLGVLAFALLGYLLSRRRYKGLEVGHQAVATQPTG